MCLEKNRISQPNSLKLLFIKSILLNYQRLTVLSDIEIVFASFWKESLVAQSSMFRESMDIDLLMCGMSWTERLSSMWTSTKWIFSNTTLSCMDQICLIGKSLHYNVYILYKLHLFTVKQTLPNIVDACIYRKPQWI